MPKGFCSLRLVWVLVFLFAMQCIYAQQKKKQPSGKATATAQNSKAVKQSVASYKIIEAPENTWCYDIFIDNRMIIHQPSVPGLPGNRGFDRQEDAAKVAQLVLHKIQHNQMPPTVSRNEMDSLKVKL